MAFVAPAVAGSAAAGASGGAAAAGSRAAAGAARGGGAKAGTRARPAGRPTVPRGTAAGRAKELVAEGLPRYKARRRLMDEFGATSSQADDLLDAAGPAKTAPAGGDPTPKQGPEPRRRSPSAGKVHMPRTVTSAVHAGGGLLLGAITYTLALVFLRDGTDGLKRWIAAKFVNRTTPAKATGTVPRQKGPAPKALRVRTEGGDGL